MRNEKANLETFVEGTAIGEAIHIGHLESALDPRRTRRGRESIAGSAKYLRDKVRGIFSTRYTSFPSLKRAFVVGLAGVGVLALIQAYSAGLSKVYAPSQNPRRAIAAISCFLIDPNSNPEYALGNAPNQDSAQYPDVLLETRIRNASDIFDEETRYDIRMSQIKDEKGKPIFDQRWWRRRAREDGFNPEIDSAYVQKIRRYKYGNRNPVFGEDWLIISAIEANIDPDRDSAYILEMLSIPNKLGETLLKGSQIIEAKEAGRDPKELIRILGMPNKKGGRLFEEEDAISYFLRGGTVSFAEAVSSVFENIDIEYNLSGKKILRYYQLGLRPDQIGFKDTDKPNAVLVYGVSDKGGAYYYNRGLIGFVEEIVERLDTFVLIAENIDEAVEAVVYVPDQDLRVFGGHGDSTSIRLGDGDSNYRAGSPDDGESMNKITLASSWIFGDHGTLSPSGVTFLNSCSTGEGGDEKENLANKAGRESGRRVIAAREEFQGNQMQLCQAYPFDICIEKDGRDITYVCN